jgi:hypothetical protein
MIYGGNGGRFECDARPYAADFGGNTVLVPKNIPVVLGATISASKNQIRTFVDQTLAGSSGLTSTAPITVNQFNLFGKDGGGTDRSVAGNQIMLVAIWDRALSDTEWNAFSANPWQLFDAGSSSSAYQSAIATPTGAAPAGPNSFAYSALGGAVFGGSAPRVRSIARVPVGSLTMAGSGQAIRGAARAPQGGLAFSGASGIVRSIARAAAGGLKLAGTAAISATAQVQARVIMPVGGLLLAGASAISRVTSRAVSGGLKLSGHALAYTGALSTLLSGILPIFARRRRRQ